MAGGGISSNGQGPFDPNAVAANQATPQGQAILKTFGYNTSGALVNPNHVYSPSPSNVAQGQPVTGTSGTTSQAGSPSNYAPIVEQAYRNILGRSPESSGANYWQNQLNSGAVSPQNLNDALATAASTFNMNNPHEGVSDADMQRSIQNSNAYLARRNADQNPSSVLHQWRPQYGGMNQGYSSMNQGFGGMNQGYSSMNQGFGGMNQGYSSMNQGFGGMNQGYGGMNQGFGGYGGMNQGFGGYGGMNQGFGGYGGMNQGFGGYGGMNQGFGGYGGMNQGFGGINRGYSSMNQGFGGMNRGYSSMNRGFGIPQYAEGGIANLFKR